MTISKESKSLECPRRFKSDIIAGPSGFEPETAGSLSFLIVKSPVLYLAELRALR